MKCIYAQESSHLGSTGSVTIHKTFLRRRKEIQKVSLIIFNLQVQEHRRKLSLRAGSFSLHALLRQEPGGREGPSTGSVAALAAAGSPRQLPAPAAMAPGF